jgi:hypothetical protein
VKAEYKRPSECGKWISFAIVILLPSPRPAEVVAHSPTPSIVRIAAWAKGDGKKAEAAWLK